jgi:hypothetical protein
MPGGPLTSKPTWLNTPEGVRPRRLFFALGGAHRLRPPGKNRMDKSNSTMARKIAQAAIAFTTGAVVQVFLLSGSVPTETWSGIDPGVES